MSVHSKKLFKVFKTYQDKKFLFVKPEGNYGDDLIYIGAEKLAKTAGLDMRSVRFDDFMSYECNKDEVIYVHGGGSFNAIWRGKAMDVFIKAYNEHDGILIVGPQTVIDDADYLNERVKVHLNEGRKAKCHFFVREMTSYNIVSELLGSLCEVEHDHDTAFNLTAEDLLKGMPLKTKYTLYGIRKDEEKNDVIVPGFFGLWCDPIWTAHSVDSWVRMHAYAKEIISNRTHSAILGSILGKQTTIFANSYHKNRSIWEYSLKDKGVKWLDNPGSVKNNTIFERIVKSYRFNQFKEKMFIR